VGSATKVLILFGGDGHGSLAGMPNIVLDQMASSCGNAAGRARQLVMARVLAAG